MTFAPFASSRINLANDRVSRDDSRRQEATAGEILRRFDRQPGVVLADEVGMGKTFVALAVAASVIIDRPKAGPVVVMVPPSLKHKWPKDWSLFQEKCLTRDAGPQIRAESAKAGVAFLKLLDDPPDRRAPHHFPDSRCPSSKFTRWLCSAGADQAGVQGATVTGRTAW